MKNILLDISEPKFFFKKLGFLAHCLTVAGQEENLYAKKNYDKYLSALKNSGLVSVEEKGQSAAADVGVGAEGGAGAMVLLGKMTCFLFFFNNHPSASHL